MTIYELNKRATPRPYYFNNGTGSICSASVHDKHANADTGMTSYTDRIVIDTFCRCGGDDPQADVRRLVHCANHFSAALEALKDEAAYLTEIGKIGRADQLRELVKRLEEVV